MQHMNAEYMTEVLEFVQAMNKKVTLFTELAGKYRCQFI